MEDLLKTLADAVLAGEKPVAEKIVRQAIEAGIQPEKILKEGLTPAMDEVGRRFECGEAFIPEMLIAARSMQAALAILKPFLVDTGVEPSGKVVIGTVKGDLHDIGKNLVGMMLEGAGFEIVDLGVDVPASKFVEAVGEGVKVVAMSSLLTTTMPEMVTTVAALKAASRRAQVKIIIGGAPVTEAYAQKIGADGYAPDAGLAAGLVRGLLGK
ncbi:MAG TPA: corrinoid protein [Anaerolineales bacterium]|nr:corrinoid protein [Anaerolineales bacterium]